MCIMLGIDWSQLIDSHEDSCLDGFFFFFLRSILSDFVVTSIVLVMITPPDWYNGSSILISLQSCYLWLLSNAA